MADTKDDIIIENDNDLGVDVDFSETNLFEAYHKGQSNENDDDNPNPNEEDDDKIPDEEDDTEPGKTKKTPPAEKVKLKVTNDDVMSMVKNHLAGKLNEDDDEGEDGKTPDGKKDKKQGAVLPEGVFRAVYDHFVQTLGYEPFNDESPFDGKPESFEKWLSDNEEIKIAEAAEATIAEAFTDNPNPENKGVAVDLFKFLRNGGKVADFVQTRKHDDLTPEYISQGKDDDEKLVRAKKVMTAFYKGQGWKDERIEKNIKTLETGGILLSIAEETLPEFIEQRDKQKAIVDQNNLTAKKTKETAVKQFNTNLLGIIEKEGELGSFQFKTPKEKQAIKEYMFMPTVELENGTKVPQFMVDLEKARQNPMFTLFQALVMKNKGLDLTNIEKNAANKTKNSIKDKFEKALAGGKIDNTKTESTSGSGSSQKQTRPTDFLNFDKLEFA